MSTPSTLHSMRQWAGVHGSALQGLSAPLLVVAILALMVLPIPAWLLDTFFTLNIAVALMPSTQGIYGIVVFFTNMDAFATDPYTVAGRAATAGLAMFFSAWYQGIVCAAGIKSILEGRNTLANALVSGAMPETYAVFALVMTFIMK